MSAVLERISYGLDLVLAPDALAAATPPQSLVDILATYGDRLTDIADTANLRNVPTSEDDFDVPAMSSMPRILIQYKQAGSAHIFTLPLDKTLATRTAEFADLLGEVANDTGLVGFVSEVNVFPETRTVRMTSRTLRPTVSL